MPKSWEIDKRFDAGESVLGMKKKGGKAEVEIPTQINFPNWMVEALDLESKKLAIDRQEIIKMIINEALSGKGYKAR